MNPRLLLGVCTLTALLLGLTMPAAAFAADAQKLTIYSAHKNKGEAAAIAEFSRRTGVEVEVVSGKVGELVEKLVSEKDAPVASLFIGADGAVLNDAKARGLFQAVTDERVLAAVPAGSRDRDNMWIGLTTHARAIIYSRERVKPEELSSYESLADPKWKGRVLQRPGKAQYNVSLVASLVELDGADKAAAFVNGMVANFAREATGNDRAQARDILAGRGDVSFLNTYYLGYMLTGDKEDEKAAAEAVGVFFPERTHTNICAAAVVANGPAAAAATDLIAYLTTVEVQGELSRLGFEYPVVAGAEVSDVLKALGEFTSQGIDYAVLGKNKAKAKEIMDAAGWK